MATTAIGTMSLQKSSTLGLKKKKKTRDEATDNELLKMTNHTGNGANPAVVTNGFNQASGHNSPTSSATSSALLTASHQERTAAIEDIKEEEDVVPDLPVYEDPSSYGGRRKLSRSKSNNESAESSGDESILEELMNGDENGYCENWHGKGDAAISRRGSNSSDCGKLNGPTDTDTNDGVTLPNGGRRSSNSRRRGLIEHPNFEQNCESESPAIAPSGPRRRRASTVDLSRSAQRSLIKLASSDNARATSPEPAYSNPEIEIFRQRRLSQQNQAKHRLSLAEALGSQWPLLEYTEKPEYRMKEKKEIEKTEVALIALELRKMDPTAIFKMDYWIEELVDVSCIEKEPKVVLSCKYSNPNGNVHWFKNQMEIFHGHKYNFLNENGTFSLVINRTCLEDAGLYICHTDDKTTSAELTVEERVVLYTFASPLPTGATVRRKGDLVLECVLSDSKPAVVWRIGDEVVEYTPGKYEIFRRNERCIFKFRNAQKFLDGAELSCKVNGDKTACRITVDEPEFDFKHKLSDVDVYEKETAVFECSVNDAEASVKWFKENKQINANVWKYEIKEDGVKRELYVKNVSPSDQGAYSCTVQEKQTAAKLYVAPDVVIREHLNEEQKVEHETVTLRCKVENPKKHDVRWLKDGKLLIPDKRFEVSCTTDGVLSLTIKLLKMTDQGVYTCQIGGRDTSATLNVKQSHTAPKVDISTVPRELIVKCGKNVEIDIPYTGTPRPLMKWTKNGRLTQSGGSLEFEQLPGSCVLKINNARRSDAADYELNLTNESGTEAVPITVKVVGKPFEPEGPMIVADVYKERCHLLWEPPLDDGGLGIDYYLVEIQDVEAGRKWTEVGRVQGDTQCGIPNLEAGKKYKFRVRACNEEGESEPLATEKEIIAKDPWDPPSKPGRPEIVDYDADQAEIHWAPSQHDGGAPVQKYVIEQRCLPDSTWERVGMVPPAELYAIIPKLDLGKTYEFRVHAVNQAGRSNPSDPSIALCIKATRVPPQIDRSSFSDQLKLKAGRDFSIEVRFTANPAPVASWKRTDSKDINSYNNVTITNTSTSSRLDCTRALRENTATYELTLVNTHGQDTALIEVIVIGVPGSPVGPLLVSEVRSTCAQIQWQHPVDDGGRPCMNYVVERKNRQSKYWERVSSSVPSNATQFKVTRLEEGKLYLFRVFAENDQGSGAELTTEFETEAKNPFDVPSSPDTPAIMDSSTNHIKIEWKKPVNDGGATITGYYVERRDINSSSWIRLNEKLITELEYTDFTVKEKKQYEYRILAENEGGLSAPSSESIPTKAKLLKEQGRIQGVSINGGSVSRSNNGGGKENQGLIAVRAGGTVRIELQISGSPPPVVTWSKDDKALSLNNRISQQSNEDSAALLIQQAGRKDSGLYTARVQNEFGFELSTFGINILDVPSCPQLVRVDELFSDRCRLSWKPPQDDGGHEIMGYSVEVLGEGLSNWDKLSSCIAGLSYTVRELRNGKTYNFRVRAENLYGESAPAETGCILAKNPFTAPGEPTKPEVVDSDNDFILVKWNRPAKDGGSPIQGYIVERKDPLTNLWLRLNSQLLTSYDYRDRAVQAGKQYEYRITAVSAGGASDYSLTSGFIKAKPLKESPSIALSPNAHGLQATVGETLNLAVPFRGSPTPTITWIKNGQPLKQSAKVKMTNGEDMAHLCIYGANADDSGMYTITLTNAFGQVSDIVSVNILGGSKKHLTRARSVEPTSDRSSTLSLPSSEEMSQQSPAFSFPLRDRIIQQGVGVKLITCVSGRPMPKVTWYKDGRDVTNDVRFSTSLASGVCSLEILSCSMVDAGKYTCVAANSAGEATTACRVSVHEREMRRRQSFSISRTFTDEFISTPSVPRNGFKSYV